MIRCQQWYDAITIQEKSKTSECMPVYDAKVLLDYVATIEGDAMTCDLQLSSLPYMGLPMFSNAEHPTRVCGGPG